MVIAVYQDDISMIWMIPGIDVKLAGNLLPVFQFRFDAFKLAERYVGVRSHAAIPNAADLFSISTLVNLPGSIVPK